MERPNHLQAAHQTNSSRLTGAVLTGAILGLTTLGLITALASGQIMKQLQDIKATVEREKPAPKAPPPPPPDLEKPPPPTAIVPEFQVETAPPPPPVTVAPKAPPPVAKAAPPPPPTELKAIARTHTLPPYPVISQRLGEHGTTGMNITISAEGIVTECKVTKTSSADRLDQAACDWIKNHWRWQPPTQNGQAVQVTTAVNYVWDLKDAQ